MTTINNWPTDRENLEWLIYFILISDNPCITTDKGRELLGFQFANDMRDWMAHFKNEFNRINALHNAVNKKRR